MALSCKRPPTPNGLFFYDHIVPTKAADVDKFLHALRLQGQDGLDTLGYELDRFLPTQLNAFLTNILSRTNDEDILKLVYQSPIVVRSMNYDLVTTHFDHIYKIANAGLISQEFFEDCASSLIENYDSRRGLNLLASFSKILKAAGSGSTPSTHDLKSDSIDKAMASHLSKVLPLLYDNNIFLRASDSLHRLDLPASLGVMLKHRMEAGDEKSAAGLVSELFSRDRLSDGAIAVIRRELGDEAFLDCCAPYCLSDKGFFSVLKLAPIFGEEVFHTPQLLGRVRWRKDDLVYPDYIKHFHKIGFDEKRMPLLADHLLSNLGLAMRFQKNIAGFSTAPDVAKLAKRVGREVEAMAAFIEGQRDLSRLPANATSAQILVGIDVHPSHPDYGNHGWVNAALLDVIDATGLEALQAVAPDCPGKLIAQYLEAKGSDRSRREVFKLFPQSKGYVLENDLGM